MHLGITARQLQIVDTTRAYFCIENVMSDTMTAISAAYDVLLLNGLQKVG
jgi:hypothetical protein